MDASSNTDKALISTAIQETASKPVVGSTETALPSIAKKSSTVDQLAKACPKESQWVLVILLMIAGILVMVNLFGFLPWSTRPSELHRGELPVFRIDLNKASAAELMQLPGIGPKTAERIVNHRERHGKFGSVAELVDVPDIGDATIRRLSKWICVDEDAKARNPKKNDEGRAKTTAATKKFNRININTATAADLERLDYIGPVLSKRIVAERQENGPYVSIDDLQRVYRIGPKTVENIREFVTIGE